MHAPCNMAGISCAPAPPTAAAIEAAFRAGRRLFTPCSWLLIHLHAVEILLPSALSQRISFAAQVAALQEWRGALWRICHGSLSVRGDPRAETLRPEPLAHAWLHLRKSLDGLAAAAPGAMALPEAAALRDAAGRMDHALGLEAGPPAKPYLWRAGGHPVPPPTAALCDAAARLAALAELTRPHAGLWVGKLNPNANPSTGPIARLAIAGVELPGAALQLPDEGEGSPEDADARESAAEAALAALSADWSLRQALLEGLGFFALAVQRVRESGVAAGRGGDSEGRAAGGEALEVVDLLRARVQARVQEVRLHGTCGASVYNLASLSHRCIALSASARDTLPHLGESGGVQHQCFSIPVCVQLGVTLPERLQHTECNPKQDGTGCPSVYQRLQIAQRAHLASLLYPAASVPAQLCSHSC